MAWMENRAALFGLVAGLIVGWVGGQGIEGGRLAGLVLLLVAGGTFAGWGWLGCGRLDRGLLRLGRRGWGCGSVCRRSGLLGGRRWSSGRLGRFFAACFSGRWRCPGSEADGEAGCFWTRGLGQLNGGLLFGGKGREFVYLDGTFVDGAEVEAIGREGEVAACGFGGGDVSVALPGADCLQG